MRLGHNMFSLGIFRNYKNTIGVNSKSLENISTGLKLNSAKDNPNKIAQSESLKLQILAREAAKSNIQDTNSMLQTFDGALQEMNNNITRLSELAVKAANGTNSDEDLGLIQKEIDHILAGLDDIAKNTSFNGIKLSGDSGGAIALDDVGMETGINNNTLSTRVTVIGEMSGEKVEISFYDLSCKGLGIDKIDVTSDKRIDDAIEKVANATNIVSRTRSKYGSLQSRLEGTYDSMSDINEDLVSAQSNIADSDIAEEMLNFAKTNIMYQSAISLMAQSNKFPQDALNILASVK